LLPPEDVGPTGWTEVARGGLFRSPPVDEQQLLSPAKQPREILDVLDGAAWVQSLKEQDLRPIEGADSRQVALVEQGLTNRAFGLLADAPHGLV
jgi:hypothetical protein